MKPCCFASNCWIEGAKADSIRVEIDRKGHLLQDRGWELSGL